MSTLLHVSDLHFGVYSVTEQVAAIETLIARNAYDVVAISGDLTQRARKTEYAAARAFLERMDQYSTTFAVPGNHDVTWWRAPLHIGFPGWMYIKWRGLLGRPIEPALRIGNAVIAGVNTAHGVSRHTLTRRMRDLSVMGDVRDRQIARVAREFDEAAPADFRVVVMHHNPVAGEISGRLGFRNAAYVLDEFAKIGTDLILCGHDHQEQVHFVEHTLGGMVVSTAGTLTTRLRGDRPASVNAIELDGNRIVIHTLVWNAAVGDFFAGPERVFEKTRRREDEKTRAAE